MEPSTVRDAYGTSGMSHSSANFFIDVPRQVIALTKKNFILAYRNRTATFLRVFASFFFILLIFLVNVGLKSRFSADPYFKDYPNPPRIVVPGIPACVVQNGLKNCFTFAYCPAPDTTGTGFQPSRDFATLAEFQAASSCPTTSCDEMFRVHRLVRMIMAKNSVVGSPAATKAFPIPSTKVLGFANTSALDTFLFNNPTMVQGAYIFAAPYDNTYSFVLQVNSTTVRIRGDFSKPYQLVAVPMQAAASRAAAQLGVPGLGVELGYREFAHPAYAVSTFEGTVAPIFLLGCAMFPFVIQMNEIVAERELKLRQALGAMGLRDTSYWLSWHLYQSAMALLFAFFIWVFGCIFQFRMFLKNDFGVVLLTFWLFGQAMVGLAFLVGSWLARAAQAVAIGFGVFLLGFVLFFMILFAGFPYGSSAAAPYSYTANITTGNLTRKDAGADLVWAPLLAFAPPTLLIKCIGDMGTSTASDSATGLRMDQAYAYCQLADNCDPDFSVGKCWGWFIGLYVLYSCLGLYCENVLPDAMGVRKNAWYFLLPSYWGIGHASKEDRVEAVEKSTDEDVVEEERRAQARANQAMDGASAIEIRGLRATFRRGGKEFHAVKCPWYSVGKRQLFALLGPNGAGKTTTINMLTGFLPPSGGNALVFGETVAHTSGMMKIRRLMGVCPQFDILWDKLSAREHLVLFGTIKGIKVDSLRAEADKRLEEVRLTDTADQCAGAYSGGMKRRLSVAVALAGNPDVVYLDEPTTGMDPINRRHVWDVIEAAKQDRAVVLTTHSMEEADILGDRIGIMAKGRLRCLGTSVRLKTRFGEGYKVSVSVGDQMRPDSPACLATKRMFQEWLGSEVEEETKAYMHFGVPAHAGERLADFFAALDARREELGVSDVQLSMSTLEDVFLRVATESELEEAKQSNRTLVVQLSTGEQVGVLVGSEELLTSPGGVAFRVKWGTDEDGRLTPSEVKELRLERREFLITCPDGVSPGQTVRVMLEGMGHQMTVPEGVAAGQQFQTAVMVPVAEAEAPRGEAAASTAEFSQATVRERVEKLRTPFARQAEALFRKNLAFQLKRRLTNACLVLVPLLVLLLVFGAQALLETLFLGSSSSRCPYCGPADDDWGQTYCSKGSSCVEYFFPNASRGDYQALFRTDVVEQCAAVAGLGPKGTADPAYCFGKGNISCYQPQWATGGQAQFCPYTAGRLRTNPQLGLLPSQPTRAAQPVLVTSEAAAADLARRVANRTAASGADAGVKLAAAQREANRQVWTLLAGVPLLGCSGAPLQAAQAAAVCQLLQPQAGAEACCVDLTGDSAASGASADGLAGWQAGQFVGTLQRGVNYWSDMGEVHSDAAYAALRAACVPGDVGHCNQAIMTQWSQTPLPPGKFGVRFGSGRGKFLAMSAATAAVALSGLSAQTLALLQARLAAGAGGGNQSFTCVAPGYPAGSAAEAKLGGGRCVNLEEGLATLAQAQAFPRALHPAWEAEPQPVPECSARADCAFAGVHDPILGSWYPDTPGRWAQVCDYYTAGMARGLSSAQQQCDAEKGCPASGRCPPEVAARACPQADGSLARLVGQVPCLCRWLYFSRNWLAALLPSSAFPSDLLRSPELFSCPADPARPASRDCSPRPPGSWPRPAALAAPTSWTEQYNVLSMEEVRLVTSLWPGSSFFLENAFSPDPADWWNRAHTLTSPPAPSPASPPAASCEQTGDCWIKAAKRRGELAVLATDCGQLVDGACFLQRLGNLTGLRVACVSAAPRYVASGEELDRMVYAGHTGGAGAQEYVGAVDLHNSGAGLLNLTVGYNDTTQSSSGFGAPRWVRLSQPLSAAVSAFLAAVAGPSGRTYAALMSIKEMPKVASFLSLDFGSLLGPFFFTLAWNILFPTIVVSLVYEKEMKLRVMMRMMGMGTSAYWVINYLFWLVLYLVFTFIFLLVGSLITLSSGYRLGLFFKQDPSIHLVFFLLFINHTIGFAMLWSALLRSSRVAQIAGTLWVVGMAVIAWSAWDSGNFFNTDIISEGLKTFITLWPVWGFYRGWGEYKEYALQASRLGRPGIQWDDVLHDPRCGMGTVLVVMLVEWPLFVLAALYLDQVLDSGHRVPRHPLFFLNLKRHEEGSAERHDAVMMMGIRKVYPPYMGNKAKTAVKTLTMGVQHGECFGMLGPNGAGKTTTINMLVGFTRPTAGTATVEGFDICADMDRIYTLMGVCPQHDILWETLTARQHMLFYGRLKNLDPAALKTAVFEGLREVNLLHVMDEMAGTFSGGMKRRLSVAISMIGSPLCCYLDEPSTGLDPASRRTLWVCIKRAKKTRAIFLTTHSMEEAEGLCDRLGIFVDGALRCIGNPKELTARFGGFYILTVTGEAGAESDIAGLVLGMAPDVRVTYCIAGTQKFEMASNQVTLSQVFRTMTDNRAALRIRDWGIANTTLEEAFIKISRAAGS